MHFKGTHRGNDCYISRVAQFQDRDDKLKTLVELGSDPCKGHGEKDHRFDWFNLNILIVAMRSTQGQSIRFHPTWSRRKAFIVRDNEMVAVTMGVVIHDDSGLIDLRKATPCPINVPQRIRVGNKVVNKRPPPRKVRTKS